MTKNNTNAATLPESRKLGEVCTYSKGKKPPHLSEKLDSNNSIPYINIKAFEKSIYNEYTDGLKSNLCEENDILMVWDGARCGLIGKAKKGAVGSTLMKIEPKEGLDKEYLYYFLMSKFHILNTKSKGVGIPHIEPTLLWNFELVVPSIDDQQAIVAKIEELLSELENGKQQLLTVLQQLKVYRQSLLKWAFEGRLTNKNVKDGELPKGWKSVELKSVVEKISDGPFGSNLKSIDYVERGVRVIRLENIGVLEFRDEHKTYVTPEKYETIKRHTVSKGDIIFSSFILDSVRSVILPDFIEKAVNKADCFLVRPDESKMNKTFLSYYFSTKAMQNQLVNQIHGATRPRINTTQLKAALVPFAPLKEQQLIADELESKLTVCNKIEEIITNNLQQTQTLKQSILKKAFEGKLI